MNSRTDECTEREERTEWQDVMLWPNRLHGPMVRVTTLGFATNAFMQAMNVSLWKSFCITQFLASSFYAHSSYLSFIVTATKTCSWRLAGSRAQTRIATTASSKEAVVFETTTVLSYERIMSLNKLILRTRRST